MRNIWNIGMFSLSLPQDYTNKRMKLINGFLIGGCLVLAGLALQLCVGPVVWEAFAWPANGIVLAGFIAILTGMVYLRKKIYAFRWMTTYSAAIPAMVYAVALTIIMGLTRQQAGGTWLNNMLSFWPFVLIYVYITVILGLVIHRRLRKIFRGQGSMLHDIPFMLNHLGLFVALTTATLGNADMQRVKMICGVGEPEWQAVAPDGLVKRMPFTIELKKFIMETYDDGKPRRFASEIQILTESGKNIEAVVDVNKPYEVEGWKIYQYGYDTTMGADSQITILELVSDPWLPAVYTGFFLMLTGTLFLLAYTRWSYKRLLPIGILVVVALALVSYFMPVIRSKELVPALQSPWFTPHILVYIVCYSLMGVAAVMALMKLIGGRWWRIGNTLRLEVIDSLVYVGLIFMTFGMLFGALWAKEAWGHYWSWDPKETWAAITWLSFLVYVHYRLMPKAKSQEPNANRLALCLLIISFVLLQMCWWGINYLPSAQGASVHTYNM